MGAAWGGTASVEPKPEPPMEADGPTGVPVEPEPPAETPAPAEASAKRETDMEPEPPVSTPEERDSPDAFAAAFARQDEPSTRSVPGARGIGAVRPGGTGFAGRVRYGLRRIRTRGTRRRARPGRTGAIRRVRRGLRRSGTRRAPEPDVPPEFRGRVHQPGESDLSNEPEDLAERARLERIGMETADPTRTATASATGVP